MNRLERIKSEIGTFESKWCDFAHRKDDIKDLVGLVETVIEVVDKRRKTRRGSLPARADNFQNLVAAVQPFLKKEEGGES